MDKKDELIELDYEEKKKEFVQFLESGKNTTMVLATSYKDRVLARNVLTVSKGLDIYFFTWRHSRKCRQIQKNPQVALCKDNVQIEGVAVILGNFVEERTKKYTDIIRNRFPEAVKRWEDRPGMVIVRVRPTLIVIGGRTVDNNIYLDFLDLKNDTAYAEKWAYY